MTITYIKIPQNLRKKRIIKLGIDTFILIVGILMLDTVLDALMYDISIHKSFVQSVKDIEYKILGAACVIAIKIFRNRKKNTDRRR